MTETLIKYNGFLKQLATCFRVSDKGELLEMRNQVANDEVLFLSLLRKQ